MIQFPRCKLNNKGHLPSYIAFPLVIIILILIVVVPQCNARLKARKKASGIPAAAQASYGTTRHPGYHGQLETGA